MQVTFLIGNGFDLNLGLNTRYSDFLETYKHATDGDSKEVKKFKEEILTNEKLWSDSELAFGRYTVRCKELGISAETFCDLHEDFDDKLGEYLLREEQRVCPSDIAPAFGASLKKILQGLTTVQKEQVQASINRNEYAFSYNFIIFNYTEIIDKIVTGENTAKLSLGMRRVRNTSENNSIGKVIHVHGTTDTQMVLGVNDISQIACPELFEGQPQELIESMIKVQANKMFEEKTDETALAILNQSDLIYVYGMALGDTDALWWDRVCQVMKSKPSLHTIIHVFNASVSARHRRKLVTFETRVKNRLCSFTKDASASLRDRIHIDASNIFEEIKDACIVKEKSQTA